MALAGCYFCIKYLLFAFNFIFWLLGCCLVGVGFWAKYSPETLKSAGDKAQNVMLDDIFEKVTESWKIGIFLIIVLGIVIFIIGFLGCCGAIKESKCLLGMFFFFLLIIFSALLALGVYFVVHKSKVKDHIGKVIDEQVNKFEAGDEDAKSVMVSMQEKLKCCGAKYGVVDYKDPSMSQCKSELKDNPCVEELYNSIKSYRVVLSGLALGVAMVMILGMVFSMLLCCAIREQI